MKEENEEKNANVEEVISTSEQFIVKNQKMIIIIMAAILVVILAFFGFRKFYFQPRQVKANEAIFAAEQYFAQNDYQTALNGNAKHDGFLAVANRYGHTKAGKRAKYDAGLCYLHMGNYEEATKMLKSYSGKDTFTPILAKIAEGDAECELGHNKQALKLYEDAAGMDDNFITSPMAYFKAGMMYVIMGDGAKAKTSFEKIKSYPESTEFRDVEKYIALAENL
jgi:tetratricopeptide (TPR) repeat protein